VTDEVSGEGTARAGIRYGIPPTAEPPPLEGRHSPEEGDPYQGRRGHTKIAPRAVARIVARALGADGGGLHQFVRPVKGPAGGPKINVSVDGDLVTARVRMAVAYPEPVREVATQARDRVRARVQDLTGLTVRQVDIDVARLEPRGTFDRPRKRRVR
jgi:uncharacterized alkaline shock family protein YloU